MHVYTKNKIIIIFYIAFQSNFCSDVIWTFYFKKAIFLCLRHLRSVDCVGVANVQGRREDIGVCSHVFWWRHFRSLGVTGYSWYIGADFEDIHIVTLYANAGLPNPGFLNVFMFPPPLILKISWSIFPDHLPLLGTENNSSLYGQLRSVGR